MTIQETQHDNMATQETKQGDMASQELAIDPSPWDKTPDWWGLIELNKTFLKIYRDSEKCPSKDLGTPYEPDLNKHLIPRLLSLHEYGLFVVSCQGKQLPGLEKSVDFEETQEAKQTQYIEFFIPDGENNRRLAQFLLTDNQLEGVAFDWERVRLAGSSENDIEVAWSPAATSMDSLDTTGWVSVISATYESEPHADLVKIKTFRETRPMFCAIAVFEDDVDLLERLEKHVKAAGITMQI